MDSVDALAPPEPADSDVHTVETSDQARLLVQIANGLIAAHARIDVLEGRLIASTRGAVKSEVGDFAADSRDSLAKLHSKVASSVVEISKTIDTRASQTSNQTTSAISSATTSIKQNLTEVERNLSRATEHGRSMTERQVALLSDSVTKGFEQIDQRLDKAEQEQVASAKRARTITLRWGLVFLLIGLALLSPYAYQLYRFLNRGRG